MKEQTNSILDTVFGYATVVWGWIDTRPAFTALIAVMVLVLIMRNKARKQRIATTGALEPPVLSPITDMVRFTLNEDNRPLLKNGRAPWWTARTAALTGTGVGVLGILVGPLISDLLGVPAGDILGVLTLVLTWMVLSRRFKPVSSDRLRTRNKMFDIANTKLKLTRGAELNKHAYVQVTGWRDLVVPQQVTIVYPDTVDAGSEAVQNGFQQHFNAHAQAGTAWRYQWEPTNNRVIITAQPPLPETVPLPFPTVEQFAWNEFPLGIAVGNEPLVWNPTVVPHVLVAGVSGSGKSVMQRNILLHALQSDRWKLILIDPKRVELSQYKNSPNVLMYAVEDETMLEALEYALEQMSARYKLMEDQGITLYLDLPQVPDALLVMVDEATSLLAVAGDKEADAGKKRAKSIIGKIAREGRAAGVHVVLATQRPDASVLGGDTRNTVEGRIAMGKMNSTASLMVLNNDLATRTPGRPRGRGIWSDGAEYHAFQSYFIANEDVKHAVDIAGMLRNGTVTVQQVRDAMTAQAPGSTSQGDDVVSRVRSWVSRMWSNLSERAASGVNVDIDDDDHVITDDQLDTPTPPVRKPLSAFQTAPVNSSPVSQPARIKPPAPLMRPAPPPRRTGRVEQEVPEDDDWL